MHNALHPRDNVDRLYMSRNEGGRELASIKDRVDTSIQRLEDVIEKPGGRLVIATKYNTDNTKNNGTEITRKQKWEEKQLSECFQQLTSDISPEKTWTWLRGGNLKRKIESLLITAQNNAIKTNHIKVRIDKTQHNSKCRLCGDRDETIYHIISECSKLTQKKYKTRHDCVGKVIHWELCKRFKSDRTNKWYMCDKAVWRC